MAKWINIQSERWRESVLMKSKGSSSSSGELSGCAGEKVYHFYASQRLIIRLNFAVVASSKP